MLGYTAHVPHYLSQSDYPQAAVSLLEQVCKSCGLALPMTELLERATAVNASIAEQVVESEEVAAVVAALEQQYDAFIAAQENRSLLARDDDLPSGDELGAEFERFLAQQTGESFGDDPADGAGAS